MAYFSNGSEGEVFDIECIECVFGELGCPVFYVQSTYNYEACNNKVASKILNDLVKQKNREFIGCQLKRFLYEEETKEKLREWLKQGIEDEIVSRNSIRKQQG